jgi:hypothetical protein
MASVFLISDILHPEYQSRNLMPALQVFGLFRTYRCT